MSCNKDVTEQIYERRIENDRRKQEIMILQYVNLRALQLKFKYIYPGNSNCVKSSSEADKL